jgi:hydrogenase maturation factor
MTVEITARNAGGSSGLEPPRASLPGPDYLSALLAVLRGHPPGREAAIIGDLIRKPEGMAIVETAYGSRRVLEMPIEEQPPRIY